MTHFWVVSSITLVPLNLTMLFLDFVSVANKTRIAELQHHALRHCSCFKGLESFKEKNEITYTSWKLFPTSPTHISLKSVSHYFFLATKSCSSLFPNVPLLCQDNLSQTGAFRRNRSLQKWGGGNPTEKALKGLVKWIPHLDRNQQLTHIWEA